MKNVAAIYVRLSKDDLNTDYSRSIENQIIGLKEYCHNNQFKIYDVFIDDGYSGSNFDRPGFQEMIKMMELKKFDTIIIKDLSRLGRNFVHVGQYIENVFPNNNIRLISLSDNYDSLTYTDDESIVLRSFLNDYYLKDCKKKAQAAVAKRSKKTAMSTGGIYGFKYDENKKLIIDEVPARIVLEIFTRYSEGELCKDILNDLKERKVPTPAYQSIINYGKNRYSIDESNYFNWDRSMFDRILKNKEYTGVAVNRSTIVRNGKWIKNNEAIEIENAIPQMISKELFDKANVLRSGRSYKCIVNLDDKRLLKTIYCKECGSSMVFCKERNKYICQHCKKTRDALVIHQVILTDCRSILKEYNCDQSKLKKRLIAKLMSTDDTKEIKRLTLRKSQIDLQIENLFEKKINMEITQDEYKNQLSLIKEENREIEIQLARFDETILNEKLITERFKEFSKSLESVDLDNPLDLIRCMVSKIVLEEDPTKIKIVYKFDIE